MATSISTKVTSALEKTGGLAKKNPVDTMYIILGAAVLFGAYQLVKNVGKASSRLLTGDPNIDDKVNTSGANNPVTSRLSITRDQARIYAQQLLEAMNAKQPFYGTDEATILAIFNKINPDDFKLIYQMFGDKDYNGNNSPPQGWWSVLDSYEPHNLVYWLKSEIGPRDGAVYTKVKSIVEQAGWAF